MPRFSAEGSQVSCGFTCSCYTAGVSIAPETLVFQNGDVRLHATRYFVGPWGNRNLFMALSHAAHAVAHALGGHLDADDANRRSMQLLAELAVKFLQEEPT